MIKHLLSTLLLLLVVFTGEIIAQCTPPVVYSFATQSPNDCGKNGSIECVTTSGISPFEFLWSNGETTPLIDDLTSGSYALTLTDSTGCVTLDSITLFGNDSLSLSLLITPTSGPGMCDGQIEIIGSGGTSPYIFTINGTMFNVNNVFSGLCSGNYCPQMYDQNSCFISFCDSVPEGQLTSFITHPDWFMICKDSNETELSVLTNDLNPTTDSIFLGIVTQPAQGQLLLASNSLFFLPDANFLGMDTAEYVVCGSGNMCDTASIYFQIVACGGSQNLSTDLIPSLDANCEFSGVAEVVTTGGISPYSLLWSNGASIQQVGGLSEGFYCVTVSDAGGNISTTCDSIFVLNGLSALVNVSEETCPGTNNGTLNLQGAGGNGPYQYAIDCGMTYSGSGYFNGLTPGNYCYSIIDIHGCTTSDTVTVDSGSLPDPHFTYTQNGNLAHFSPNLIDSTSTSYLWNFGDMNTAFALSPTHFYALPDTYSVCLTVTNLCGTNQACQEIIATEFAYPIADHDTFTVCMDSSAQLSILWNDTDPIQDSLTVAILQGPYYGTASLNDQNISYTPNSQYFGSDSLFYQVCNTLDLCDTAMVLLQVRQCNCENEPSILSFSSLNSDCGLQNGYLSILSSSGGIPPYQYLWENGSSSALQDSLSAGIYIITVTDAQGCSGIEQLILEENTTLELNAEVRDATCDDNGKITLWGSGGAPPYTYSLNSLDFDTQYVFSNLPPGLYTCWVKDSLGCTDQDSFLIESDSLIDVNFNFSSMETTVHFTNWSDPQDSTVSFLWNFGDGNTSGLAHPTHTYTAYGTYEICLTMYTECGLDSICKSLSIIEISTHSLQDRNNLLPIIYPNPATTSLFIHLTNGNLLKLEVVDLQGQIFSSALHLPSMSTGNDIQINTKKWPRGVFILKMTTESGTYTQKVLLH